MISTHIGPERAAPHIVKVYVIIKFSFLVLLVGNLDLDRKGVTFLAIQTFSTKPELENGLFTPSSGMLDIVSFATNHLFNFAR